MKPKILKLFVGSIPSKTDSQDLLEALWEKGGPDIYFPKFEHPVVIKNGFCVIACKHDATYNKLLSTEITLKDRTLDINKFREGNELEAHKIDLYRKRIIIDKLEACITASDLEIYFGRFGPLQKVFRTKVQHKMKTQHFVGHVIYERGKDADAAIKSKPNHFYVRGILVSFDSFLARHKNSALKKGVPRCEFSLALQNLQNELSESQKFAITNENQILKQRLCKDSKKWIRDHQYLRTLQMILAASQDCKSYHTNTNLKRNKTQTNISIGQSFRKMPF